jgi:hypothetical protein
MSRALFNCASALLIKSKNARNVDEFMSAIVAKRLVEHLERVGFVIIKRPPNCRRGRGF